MRTRHSQNENTPVVPWTTASEKEFITYLASDDKRPGRDVRPTIKERKAKLMSWLGTSYIRRWDKGVNPDDCRSHASKLYGALEQMEKEKVHV